MAQAILGKEESTAILALSFASSAIASYVTFVNPAIKWQQLRMAALSIESNIWTFRTRAGPYRAKNDSSFDQSAEHLLAEVIKDVKEKVLEGADIKSSSFYARVYSTNIHGQHPAKEPTFGAMDNFTRLIALERAEHERRGNESAGVINSQISQFSKGLQQIAQMAFRLGSFRYGRGQGQGHNISKVVSSRKDDEEASRSFNFMKKINDLENQNDDNDDIWSEEGGDRSDNEGEVNEEESTSVKPFSSVLKPDEQSKAPPKDPRARFTHKSSFHFTELQHSRTTKSLHKRMSLAEVLGFLRRDTDEMDGHATVDSHYEPVQPDAFIRFRVIPAINFYKSRIPRCHRTRNISQLLLVIGSLGSAILAIIGIATWASGISIVTASITAYLEFTGTSSKISRYSFTVHALQDLCYWWQTLPQIDRSVVSNIDRLVLTCEELLQREQQAWRSTSQTVRMLQKQSQHDSSASKEKPE